MECPYCGAELNCTDTYGRTVYADHYYIYPQSWIEKQGDIYECPNSEGFETKRESEAYLHYIKETLESLGVQFLEEVVCDSAINNGHFYTDSRDDLHEGYPC